jgi:hypothetical protein
MNWLTDDTSLLQLWRWLMTWWMIDDSWWIDWMTERGDAFTWLQSDRQLWPPPGLSMVMQSLTVIGPLHQVIGSSGFGRQMVGCVQCRQNWRWRQVLPEMLFSARTGFGKKRNLAEYGGGGILASSGGNPPPPTTFPPSPPPSHHAAPGNILPFTFISNILWQKESRILCAYKHSTCICMKPLLE